MDVVIEVQKGAAASVDDPTHDREVRMHPCKLDYERGKE
jgi:hypothetical protein